MYNSIKNNSLPRFLNLVFSLLLISFLAACSRGGNPGPAVNIASASMAEGNGTSSNLSFTITLAKAADGATSVHYATSDGTAVVGQDYTAASGTVTIPAGNTSATIDISITGDTTYEADETFTVTLSSPSGLSLGSSSSATGTITNDDNADPKGYYTGTANLNSGSTTIIHLIGLVYDKSLLLFSRTGESNVLYNVNLGTITNHTEFSGTADVYENGTKTQSVTVVGTTNDALISGTLSGGTGIANGTFDLLFETSNNRGATLSRIEALGFNKWTGNTYGYDVDTASFAVSSGSYSGFDDTTEKCQYTATFVIPDNQINIYEMDHAITDPSIGTCAPPYESMGHTGFAAVIDTMSTDDTLVYAFTNGTIALFAVMNH